MEPDYKTYSLEELYDAKAHIDSERYPQRYADLMSELELRVNDVDSSVQLDSTEGLFAEGGVLMRVLAALCAVFVFWMLMSVLSEQEIVVRKHFIIELASSPVKFYMFIALDILLLLCFLYVVFKKPNKEGKDY